MNEKQRDYWQDYQVLKLETWINEFNPEEINIDEIQKYLEFIKESIKNYDENHYSEWHHVLPKCVDKDHKFDKEGVRINGADHFKAHIKLVECFNNGQIKYKLSYALTMMKRCTNNLSSEEYEKAKKLFSKNQTGDNNPSRIYGVSSETRSKISKAVSGKNNPFYNKEHSTESKQQMSKSHLKYYETHEAAFKGRQHTEESRKKMSESHKGHPCSNKTRLKMSQAHKKENLSEKTLEKMSKSHLGELNINYGKPRDTTVKEKISKTLTGRKLSKEQREKISKANKGKKRSEEAKKHYSEAQKGCKNSCYGKRGITNGIDNKFIVATDDIPEGWRYGLTIKKKK